MRIVQGLDNLCRDKISRAGALTVILDSRPLNSAEDKEGMAACAKAAFESWQSVPCGIPINRKSYLPSLTAINTAMKYLLSEQLEIFAAKLRAVLSELGCAVLIDGATLKLQDRHFYDSAMHHVYIVKRKTVLVSPVFNIKSTTVLFLEGPRSATGVNLRALFYDQLRLNNRLNLYAIHRKFTIVISGILECNTDENNSSGLKFQSQESQHNTEQEFGIVTEPSLKNEISL